MKLNAMPAGGTEVQELLGAHPELLLDDGILERPEFTPDQEARLNEILAGKPQTGRRQFSAWWGGLGLPCFVPAMLTSMVPGPGKHLLLYGLTAALILLWITPSVWFRRPRNPGAVALSALLGAFAMLDALAYLRLGFTVEYPWVFWAIDLGAYWMILSAVLNLRRHVRGGLVDPSYRRNMLLAFAGYCGMCVLFWSVMIVAYRESPIAHRMEVVWGGSIEFYTGCVFALYGLSGSAALVLMRLRTVFGGVSMRGIARLLSISVSLYGLLGGWCPLLVLRLPWGALPILAFVDWLYCRRRAKLLLSRGHRLTPN